MDTLLCVSLWRAGWSVLLMPHTDTFVHTQRERNADADARSNTHWNKSWHQYVRTNRYIKATHLYNASDAWKNRTLRRIRHLNAARLVPCEATDER